MEATSVTWVALSIGVFVSLFSLWQLLGRGRNARAWLEMSDRMPSIHRAVFFWPSLGALCLSFGLFPLAEDIPVVGDALTLVLGVVMILALVAFLWWGLFQFPFPVRWVPVWAREEVRRRKERARR
ncbi:MAG: hypothetical protein EOO70_05600 [Myxococcaceae bacterium]|nr:MAG: hypothetical protein EOO70_05600 [Myxococcaceae bacterium]